MKMLTLCAFLGVQLNAQTSLSIFWKPSTNAPRGYTIYFGTNAGQYLLTKVIFRPVPSATVTNLVPNTTYFIKVLSFDSAGRSTVVLPETVHRTGAPGTYGLIGSRAVYLSWDKSASTNVQGYKLHRGVAIGLYNWTNSVGSNMTTAMSDFMAASTIYYFAATAFSNSPTQSIFSNEVRWTNGPVLAGLGLARMPGVSVSPP